MAKTKITTTINLPISVKSRAKKYMVDIGLTLGSWVSDRITKEMDEYYKGRAKR